MTPDQTLNDIADRLEYEALALDGGQAQTLDEIVSRLRRLAVRVKAARTKVA